MHIVLRVQCAWMLLVPRINNKNITLNSNNLKIIFLFIDAFTILSLSISVPFHWCVWFDSSNSLHRLLCPILIVLLTKSVSVWVELRKINIEKYSKKSVMCFIMHGHFLNTSFKSDRQEYHNHQKMFIFSCRSSSELIVHVYLSLDRRNCVYWQNPIL